MDSLISNFRSIALMHAAHDVGYKRGYRAGAAGYISPWPLGTVRNERDSTMKSWRID